MTRRVNAHRTPVRAARRARIILLAADGVPSRQISKIVGMHESNVAKWRNRFRDKGLEGLEDSPRPGRRRRFGHDERMAMAAAATSERDPDDPVATWTYFDLAQKLWGEGIKVSVSQLWRILAAMDIRPIGCGAGSTVVTTRRSGRGCETCAACTQPTGAGPGPLRGREDLHPGQGTQAS